MRWFEASLHFFIFFSSLPFHERPFAPSKSNFLMAVWETRLHRVCRRALASYGRQPAILTCDRRIKVFHARIFWQFFFFPKNHFFYSFSSHWSREIFLPDRREIASTIWYTSVAFTASRSCEKTFLFRRRARKKVTAETRFGKLLTILPRAPYVFEQKEQNLS